MAGSGPSLSAIRKDEMQEHLVRPLRSERFRRQPDHRAVDRTLRDLPDGRRFLGPWPDAFAGMRPRFVGADPARPLRDPRSPPAPAGAPPARGGPSPER